MPSKESSAPGSDALSEEAVETRAARRARLGRSGPTVTPPSPPPGPGVRLGEAAAVEVVEQSDTRPHPVVVAGTVVSALAIGAASVTDARPVVLAVVTVVALVLAIGWPSLVASAVPRGTTAVLLLTTAALALVLGLGSEDSPLDLVPVALALGIVAMALHPLVQERARAGLAGQLGAAAAGIALLTAGFLAVAIDAFDANPVLVAMVAVAVSSVADLVTERPVTEAWMLPVSMLVGGGSGLATELVRSGEVHLWAGLLGILVAGTALALRRVLTLQPTSGSALGGVTVGVASTLVVAPLAYALARTYLG